MLQEVMEHLNNYFVPLRAELKQFTIADGAISPAFGAEDGDRFLICGSRRNDGVYTFHVSGADADYASETEADITVTVENPLPEEPDSPDGTDEGNSGGLASFIARIRSIWQRFLDLLRRILAILGVKIG